MRSSEAKGEEKERRGGWAGRGTYPGVEITRLVGHAVGRGGDARSVGEGGGDDAGLAVGEGWKPVERQDVAPKAGR